MGWRDKMHVFRFWSQKVLPQVYDDSISYYEVLNKVVAFLNELIEKMNELIDEQGDYESDINNQWNEYKIDIEQTWNDFKTNIENEWGEYKETIEREWDEYKEEIEGKLDDLKDLLEGEVDDLKDLLEGEINDLKDYVDTLNNVVITVTRTEVSPDVYTYSADKTFAEIKNLVDNGITPWVKYNNMIIPFEADYTTSLYFQLVIPQIETQTIGSTDVNVVNTVYRYGFEIANNEAVTATLDDADLRQVPISFNAGDVGKFLKKTGTGALDYEWANIGNGNLPPSTSTDEGKVLTVDSNGDPEWDTPSGSGLPASTSADEGKVLTVDSNGDPEWNPLKGVEVKDVEKTGRLPATFSQIIADIANGNIDKWAVIDRTGPGDGSYNYHELYYLQQIKYTPGSQSDPYAIVWTSMPSVWSKASTQAWDEMGCVSSKQLILRSTDGDTYNIVDKNYTSGCIDITENQTLIYNGDYGLFPWNTTNEVYGQILRDPNSIVIRETHETADPTYNHIWIYRLGQYEEDTGKLIFYTNTASTVLTLSPSGGGFAISRA